MPKENKTSETTTMTLTIAGDALKAVRVLQEKKRSEGIKVYGKECAINFLLCQQYKQMTIKL